MIGNIVPTSECRRLRDNLLVALRPTHRSFQLEVRLVNLGFSDSRAVHSTLIAVLGVDWNIDAR